MGKIYIGNTEISFCVVDNYMAQCLVQGKAINELRLPITAVRNYAFYSDPQTINYMYLPYVTSVGRYSFENFTGLRKIYLDRLVNLQDYLFNGCTNLNYISLPSVTTLSNSYVFQNCNLSQIDENSFPKLNEITGDSCFRGSNNKITELTTTTFPALTSIKGNYTFAGNTNLKKVDSDILINFRKHPDTSTWDYGDYSFQNCTGLEEVNLPNCQRLGNYAFQNCTKLKNVVWGQISSQPVTNSYMFDGCTALETVNENGVYYIREFNPYAFRNCQKLKHIDFLHATPRFTGTHCFENCYTLDYIDAPYVTYIALENSDNSYFFYGCTGLKYAHYPSVTQISSTGQTGTNVSHFFDNCTSLESIKFPLLTAFTTSSSYFFWGCSKATEIDLHSLVLIPSGSRGVFRNCASMQKYELPLLETLDGREAFAYNHKLEEMDLPSLKTLVTDNVTSSSTTVYSTFENNRRLKKVWLPSTLTSISNSGTLGWGGSDSRVDRCPLFHNVHPECIIYTDHASKPSGWGLRWNARRSGSLCKVVWGATHEDYENDTARKELFEDLTLINPSGINENGTTYTVGNLMIATYSNASNNETSHLVAGDNEGWARCQLNSGVGKTAFFRFPKKGVLKKYITSAVADQSGRVCMQWELYGFPDYDSWVNNTNGVLIDSNSYSSLPTCGTVKEVDLSDNEYNTGYYGMKLVKSNGDSTYISMGYTEFYMQTDTLEPLTISYSRPNFSSKTTSGTVSTTSEISGQECYRAMDGTISNSNTYCWSSGQTKSATWTWNFANPLYVNSICVWDRYNGDEWGGAGTYTVYGKKQDGTYEEIGVLEYQATDMSNPHPLECGLTEYYGLKIDVVGSLNYVGIQEFQIDAYQQLANDATQETLPVRYMWDSISASSYFNNSRPHNAVDNTIGTSDHNMYASNGTTTATWYGHFYKPLDITAVQIYSRYNSNSYGGNVTYTVSGLNEDDTYTELGSLSFTGQSAVANQTLNVERAKYYGIKVYMAGTKTYVGMQEIKVTAYNPQDVTEEIGDE